MQLSSSGESGQETFLSKLLHLGRKEWIILLLLGLLLAVISLPTSGKNNSGESGSTGILTSETKSTSDADNTVLEEKLQSLLSQVEGVGETQVMIMTGQEDSSVFGTSGSQKITGVLIAAEGADNSVTVQNIKEAVMALFQVEAHKIKIMKMK